MMGLEDITLWVFFTWFRLFCLYFLPLGPGGGVEMKEEMGCR